MLVKLDDQGPLSDQIYRSVRRAILAGALAPALRLPSTRALAHDLGVLVWLRGVTPGALDRLIRRAAGVGVGV